MYQLTAWHMFWGIFNWYEYEIAKIYSRSLWGQLWYTMRAVKVSKIDIANGMVCYINTLRPRQNGRHFADDVFKCIFLNGNLWISIKISLKFVPKGPINNIPALVQIMVWRRTGDKPLSVFFYHSIFLLIFLYEKCCILIQISPKFVPKANWQ